MKEIKFNIPLHLVESVKNVKKFLHSKKPLHGPGKNILRIKQEVKKKFGFNTTHLTNSCTSALEISALLLNLKKDDEVVVPSFSFITSASSFARAGCKLKFCDIEKHNLMPSFDQIKKCINKKTKAIVIVHYQGYSVNYLDKLQIFCKKKKIILIEDAAQCFGSYFKNKPLGSFGDLACFSFHETKNLHSGLGGMLVVNNKKFINRSYLIFDKGTDRHLVQTGKQKYYSWVEVGSSFLLSEFSASYLLPQILYYKKSFVYRSILYKRYIYNFNKWLKEDFYLTNYFKYKYNFHAFVILLKNNKREHFLNYMKNNKINAVISYTPLHKSKAGRKFVQNKSQLVNSDIYIDRVVRLPLHNYLKISEIDYICKKIKDYFVKN
jgi:dTDP-4-amino-4,6-dideoxygalactose transaminase